MQVEVSPFSDLEEAREYALRTVDDAAEEARLRHITSGSGQAIEYQRAIEEARRLQSGDTGKYPMLDASVDAGIAADRQEAANQVLDNEAFSISTGAVIRQTRLAAKKTLRSLSDMRSIAVKRNQAVTELRGL